MKPSITLLFLAAAIAMFAALKAANAQLARTWVSASGDDANLCGLSDPCHTFAAALTKTVAGGEIDCLTAGTFGAVTITKAITIDCGSGETAELGSTFITDSTSITIQAGANDVVQLRKLTINGLAGTAFAFNDANGINYVSGKALFLDNVDIMNMPNNGIDVAPTANATLDVVNTNIVNSGNNGIRIAAGGSGLIDVSLKAVRMSQGFNGMRAADNGSATLHVSIQDSIASSNANTGFLATTGGGRLTMFLEHASAVNSGATGVIADGSNTELHISNAHIFGNGTGLAATGGAALISYKNNEIKLNGSNGSPTGVVGFD